jgi:uncharacterized protein (DUF1786 family)
MSQNILCLDIGSGTQDALLYQPGLEIENCPKFVLPAPARLVARRIAGLTASGKAVYLHGENMGGGFWGALKAHVAAGLSAAASPEAALALGDNQERVRSSGVTIAERCPPGHTPVLCQDYSPTWWQGLLAAAGLEDRLPDLILAAAQDHGFHPQGSNRIGRFQLWDDFLRQHRGDPAALLFETPPDSLTRLRTLQRSAGNALVADTGAAAVLGALCDHDVLAAQERSGATVVNLGNSHIIAFLLFRGVIHGVYEHHSGLRDADQLLADLERFRKGALPNQEVLDSWGHGCMTLELPGEADFAPMFAMGPKRELLRGREVAFPAPGGDMMLMGCFGLLKGYRLRTGE